MQRFLTHVLLLLAVIWPALLGVYEQRTPPSVPVVEEELIPPIGPVQPIGNPLAGLPLDYLIGAGEQPGKAGRITEVAYDLPRPALGLAIAYVNLRSEKGKPAEYGPYLPPDDIERDYKEGRPDPAKPGWEKNLRRQFELRRKQGFEYVEGDNFDSYTLAVGLRAIELAKGYGLKVIAKNVGHIAGGDALLAHANVFGHIVENGAGDAASNHALRKAAGKPDQPVWFIGYNDGENGKAWIDRVAAQIRSLPSVHIHMGATFSDRGEYESSRDVQLPIKPGQPPKTKPVPVVKKQAQEASPQEVLITCAEARQGVGMACWKIRAGQSEYNSWPVEKKRQARACLTSAERAAIVACLK